MIPDLVRKIIERETRNQIEQYKNWSLDHKKTKQRFKYENEKDFWYGHILGSLLTLATMAYKNAVGRQPNMDEIEELWEITEIFAKDVREILKTWV